MRNLTLIAVFVALTSIGCQPKSETVVTGANGAKAVISNDGATQHIESTDANGTKVKEDINGSKVSYSDSKGNSLQMNTGAVTEDVLGLPFYPGSDEAKAGGSSIIDANDAKTVQSSRSTKDAPEKVQDFYKDKVTGGSNSSTTSGDTKMVIISGKLASGADAVIMVSKKDGEDTTISVTVSSKKPKH